MLQDYMKGALLLSGLEEEHKAVRELIRHSNRILFLGNGGSMSTCSHMAHDFLKVGKIKTLCPEAPNLITCLANDYGVENMWNEWLDIQAQAFDLVVIVSSSGNSMNLVNAALRAKEHELKVVTVTAFSKDNKLNQLGDVNVHFDTTNYGV